MEENFNQEPVEMLGPEKEKKNKKTFGNGVLLGIAGTLMVVVAVLLICTSVLKKQLAQNEGKLLDFINGGQYTIEGAEGETVIENTGESIDSKRVLNTELLAEAATINAFLDQYYLYDVDVEEVREGMLTGMLEALGDPYSCYYGEEELASFQDSTQGEYVGIGAAVTQEISTGIVRISKPYEGTPSAEAGLRPGDIVVSVDGTEVTGMELNQVVSLIKGEEGTQVILEIFREEEEKYTNISVTRRMVELPTVSSKMLDDQTGYIEITGFEGVTAKQFILAYEQLKEQGMQKVIFDLRENGGGLVDTVEEMLDYLLPEGTIFYVKDKNGNKALEYSSDKSAALDIPTVVLVNGNTASAAEIFAGNIQEFGLGTVVGTTTFGKGVMQQLYYTNKERTSAIKLTIADYYINSDKNINKVGVEPDVEVELDEAVATLLEVPVEQDNQLQKALEILSK